MSKKNIEEAVKLINNEKFKKAESLLLLLRNKKNTPKINYLLGCIHHMNISSFSFDKDEKKFKGSKEEAKRFLREAIDSEDPIKDAFLRLVDIEDNKKHAVRILKKGLRYFPDSKTLYECLIKKSEDCDISEIYEEIKSKKIISDEIYFRLYELFFRQKKYNEALKCIKRIKSRNKDKKQLLTLIRGFCFYELTEIEKAESIFQKLIDDDVSYKFNYAQYIGLLLCFAKSKEINKIVELTKEFPNKFEELFSHVDFTWGLVFEDYFYNSIEQSIVLLKTKKEYKEACAKLKGIKVLKDIEDGSVNKKIISELKYAQNNLRENKIFATELVVAYLQNKQIVEAFNQDLGNILEYSGYESEIEWILDDISKKDLKNITDLFLGKLNIISSWRRDEFNKVITELISALHKNEKHENIIKICNYFSEDILEEENVLFEIAFAYGKINDKLNAKRFYEKIWKKKQKDSAVANNLALLYENEGDCRLAKELLEKALELNSDDKTAQENLQRVTKYLDDEAKNIQRCNKKQKKALEDIKTENIYIYEKLANLIANEDDEKYISASYNQLCGILKARSEKVQELMQNFLQKNYIIKVQNHNIDTASNVYCVNHLVREFILKEKKRIEENKPLSVIGEKINIDSFEDLGFDNNLLQKIDLKILDNDLKDILKRDLRENTFALLTESYKTALVLSGSIIEAIILNKVRSSDIISYLPRLDAKKKKKVKEMNLSELLFVADENKIIDKQLYHFSQALRDYRNFIHPAVEIRKNIKVKKNIKDDADIAWGITKKIIFEI